MLQLNTTFAFDGLILLGNGDAGIMASRSAETYRPPSPFHFSTSFCTVATLIWNQKADAAPAFRRIVELTAEQPVASAVNLAQTEAMPLELLLLRGLRGEPR